MQQVAVISIVDDDAFVREAIADIVRSLGYDAFTFASAEHFLDSNRAEDTSCLIADLHMPGLDGLGLQGQLLAKGYRTPVIFITALPQDALSRRALSASAVAFLSKPLEERSLISSINSALKKDREQRARVPAG